MTNDEENPLIGKINPRIARMMTWYNSLGHRASIYGVAAGYCLSASLLAIINKWATMKFAYPEALTALQYLTSAVGVLPCGTCFKFIDHDLLTFVTMRRFASAAIIFYLSLFANSELCWKVMHVAFKLKKACKISRIPLCYIHVTYNPLTWI